MPQLPPADINILRRMLPEQVLDGPDQDAHDLACFNWALTGFADLMVRPEKLIDVVAGRIKEQPKTASTEINAKELAWFSQEENWTALRKIAEDYGAVARSKKKFIKSIVESLVELAIQANGLTLSDAKTNYQICIHYDQLAGEPNVEHWWIDVHGTCIEMFPRQKDIQIYKGHQDLDKDVMWGTYVTELHQSQVDRISKTLGTYEIALAGGADPGKRDASGDDDRGRPRRRRRVI